jgi:hypothetical protein
MTLEIRLRHWAELINEKNSTGKTIKEFCEYQRISTKTYYYWKRKCREAAYSHIKEIHTSPQTALVPQGFAEVTIKEKSTKPALPEPSASSGEIRAEVLGVLITANSGYPAEKLALVLRELARPC